MLQTFKNDLRLLFRYSQLFPLCFAVFVSMLGFGLVMPLLPIYARNFGATGIQLGFLTASFALTRAITTFPGGWLADKVGRKTPVMAGLLSYSIVMALYGFSQDIDQLILLRSLQGIASGIVWPVISTMIVDIVSPEDRGKAIGLYEMMWFLGMVVGPGLGGVLAGAFTVSVPFFACGFLAFVSMVLVTLTVKETAANLNRVDVSPTKLNSALKAESNKSIGDSASSGTQKLTHHPRWFFGLCVVRLIMAFSHALIQPVLSVYANEELGISEVGVGTLFTIMGLATLFTTLPMGTVSDEVGRKPILILGIVFDAASSLLVVFSGSFWPLFFVMMLRGLGRAASSPSITAMFSGLVPALARGRGMGIFNSFQNVGLVAGATVGGFLYEASSSETPFFACAIISLIGVIVILLSVSEPKQERD